MGVYLCWTFFEIRPQDFSEQEKPNAARIEEGVNTSSITTSTVQYESDAFSRASCPVVASVDLVYLSLLLI